MIWRCPACGAGYNTGICEYADSKKKCDYCGSHILEFLRLGLPYWMGGNGIDEWVTIDCRTNKQLGKKDVHKIVNVEITEEPYEVST